MNISRFLYFGRYEESVKEEDKQRQGLANSTRSEQD